MQLLCILVFVFCGVSHSRPVHVDTTIVQVQQWGVVGTQRLVEQVLLNGVSLTGISRDLEAIVQTMSTDALLPTLNSLNQTSVLRNHTVLRSRECVLEGSELHWTDRVYCDGKVCLTLDHTDMWMVHAPQALDLKALWDQDGQRTRAERIHLQEACVKLMRELNLSQEQTVTGISWPWFLIPVFAFMLLSTLIIINIHLSKRNGLRHPGGVVGAIIHYPKDMTETTTELKDSGYRTLA